MSEIRMSSIEKRIVRETMMDGLTELLLGGLLIVYGVAWQITVFIAVVVVFQILFLPRVLERMKERYVFPRIGYVKAKEEDPKRLGRGIVLYLAGAFAAWLVLLYIGYGGQITYHVIYQWIPTVLGACFVGAMTYLRGKSGDSRYWVYALAAFLLALTLSALDSFDEPKLNLTIYLWIMGGFFVGIGGLRFLKFVRENPVVESENV